MAKMFSFCRVKHADFQQFIVLFPILRNVQLQTVGMMKRRPCAHDLLRTKEKLIASVSERKKTQQVSIKSVQKVDHRCGGIVAPLNRAIKFKKFVVSFDGIHLSWTIATAVCAKSSASKPNCSH